jgi:hypothetical protein
MSFFSERKLANILGTVEETYQTSRKEKFPRNMYMGVWSRLSHSREQTMAPFPVLVRVYVVVKSEKRRI